MIISILVQTLYILHHKAGDNLQDTIPSGNPVASLIKLRQPRQSSIPVMQKIPTLREPVTYFSVGKGGA